MELVVSLPVVIATPDTQFRLAQFTVVIFGTVAGAAGEPGRELCPSREGQAKREREPMNNERNIRRTILPNGLTILTEKMEHIRSVAMGVWVRSGSRHELSQVNGISHFVEHMVFKGTKSRSAQMLAREVDAIGGNLDAFTGKETVCFNIKVLDEHVPVALDVLSDLV